MERKPNKNQHTKLTLEKKILPPLLTGFELVTFRSRVRRSNQQAIPTPCHGTLLTPQTFCFSLDLLVTAIPISGSNDNVSSLWSRPGQTVLQLTVMASATTQLMASVLVRSVSCGRALPMSERWDLIDVPSKCKPDSQLGISADTFWTPLADTLSVLNDDYCFNPRLLWTRRTRLNIKRVQNILSLDYEESWV